MINQSKLKKFAISSRTKLIGLVSDKIDFYAAMDGTKAESLGIGVQHSSLKQQLDKLTKQQLVEQVAYTWFNRFIALRFMDVNDYTHPKIVTPQGGQGTIPEILQDAIGGIIPNGLNVSRENVLSTLGDTSGGKDPQGLAYRKLLLASCNRLSSDMPEMFEQISDYTELLIPDDLLSAHSILSDVREIITDDDCKDVEIIGWLYQYYISERKDEVYANYKKNKKAEVKDIPAATQLFTPHWIVRYLVENSLGRLWLLNNPHSKIAAKMPYYIAPETAEDDYLKVKSPTELKVCDPACGSGHMLTYAFDLLYEIYNEAGYSPLEIPELILKNNLYGVEIDQRAGSLANFALVMKAKSYNPQADISKLQPNICVLQNIVFTDNEIKEYMAAAGSDLFTSQLRSNLNAFSEADNFGSLITTTIPNPGELATELNTKVSMSSLFLSNIHPKVMLFLKQAEFLSQRYHVVVANPPYMGANNMNLRLVQYLKDEFEDVKSDIFAAFVIRCSSLGVSLGRVGIMCPNVWMYISSFEKLRNAILDLYTLTNLVELPLTGFKGATVQICAYNYVITALSNYSASFIRLIDFKGGDEEMSQHTKEAIGVGSCDWLYWATAQDFKKIPGKPLAYWASTKLRNVFASSKPFHEIADVRSGVLSGNDNKFVRNWYEVSRNRSGFGYMSARDMLEQNRKWIPITGGGDFRKWYGSLGNVIDLADDAANIKALEGNNYRLRNRKYYFKEGINWKLVTSSANSFRISPPGVLFGNAVRTAFVESDIRLYLGLFNSKVISAVIACINPTVNLNNENVEMFPIAHVIGEDKSKVEGNVAELIDITKYDWDMNELSWDFKVSPLLVKHDYDMDSLSSNISDLLVSWQIDTIKVKRLEEENNAVLVKAYGLQDELDCEIQLKQISLHRNPHYRYGSDKSSATLDNIFKSDIVRDLISYVIGCVMGRYSIDKPGLILANQGDDIETFEKLVPEPRFMADADGIIPILDDEWFTDDATEQVKQFVKVTFGAEKYDENIQFIEESIGKNLRQYLVKDFYLEHVKRYKKRPIYWLFTSPKGYFRALIYMHRYRPDTLSTMRNEYLQPFIAKLEDKKSHSENMIPHARNDREKLALQKDVERLSAMLADLREYEKTLTDVASRKIAIDLDDGVKANYAKFSEVIAKVVGL